jgi:hypothetical protein
LLSVNALTSQGNSVIFETDKASIFNLATGVHIELVQEDRLWKVPLADIAALLHVEQALVFTIPPMPLDTADNESVYVTVVFTLAWVMLLLKT